MCFFFLVLFCSIFILSNFCNRLAREEIESWLLHFYCHLVVIVLCLFLTVSRVCLQCVIVVFPGHTNLISNRSAWFKPRCVVCRVKSGKFGQTAKFGQPLCLFHSSMIGIKNKLTKQTVKILMRRLIRSRLIWISTVCKRVSEFT